MSPVEVREQDLRPIRDFVKDAAEAAAALTIQALAPADGELALQVDAVLALDEEPTAGDGNWPATALVFGWGAEAWERLVYLARPEVLSDQTLGLLEQNARALLEGLVPVWSGQLEREGPEEWPELVAGRMPSPPILAVDYIVSVGGQKAEVRLLLSARVLGLGERPGAMGNGVSLSEEKVPMEKERKIEVSPPNFEQLTEETESKTPRNLDALYDLSLTVSVELGRTEMTIGEILELGKGSIIELDKLAGDPVELYVNGRKFAEGDVVVVEDRFGVRVTSLVGRSERLRSLGGGT
ncbi:MAG: flagellar motor switch protein FliN [candidate division KSB1 bacterium]|nr:flagellar motor switch protein FliN [candidate division KSB1 bacterium]